MNLCTKQPYEVIDQTSYGLFYIIKSMLRVRIARNEKL